MPTRGTDNTKVSNCLAHLVGIDVRRHNSHVSSQRPPWDTVPTTRKQQSGAASSVVLKHKVPPLPFTSRDEPVVAFFHITSTLHSMGASHMQDLAPTCYQTRQSNISIQASPVPEANILEL